MNIYEIQECLKPWMKVETWHSTHPIDEARFHKALRQCLHQAPQSIDFDSFKDAMFDLAAQLYPKLERDYLESTIERYSNRAEAISRYLHDIGEINQ